MDASSMPPEFARELQTLRRRAYGLDADIDRDPVAVQRLGELEDALHDDDRPQPADVIPLVAADVPDELQDPLRRSPVPVRTWHGSAAWRAAVIVAIVVGLCWAMSAALGPRSDAVLYAASSTPQERQDLIDQVDLGGLGMVGARLQAFGRFHELSVWTAADEVGQTCLLVGPVADGWFQIGCAPTALQPFLDLRVGTHLESSLVGELPAGSVVRFIASADGVDVWVAEASSGEE